MNTALARMGGKERLASVRRARVSGLTVQNLLEQSVRFEGPWVQNVFDFEETCDFDTLAHEVKTRVRGAQFTDWFSAEYTFHFLNGMTRQGMSLTQTPQESIERLALSPERVLLLAADAPDLRSAGEVMLNKTPHQKVQFSFGTTAVTVFLNRYSHLPTIVETVSLRQGFWQVWGDVTTRTEYGNWQLLPGGWRYPFVQTVRRNRLPQSVTTLTQVTLETAPDRPAVAVQAETKGLLTAIAAFPPARTPAFAPRTAAEGILQFPGVFNTQVVAQADGLIVIEAVNTSAFNEALLADLAKRFPDRKVKAVIVTDDAWPHCGGIRPYVARNIPVYAPTENRTILEGLAQAPFTLAPDAQQTARRRLRLKPISARQSIGSGPNRLEIIPLRGSESERMCVVYFPERKLLYASDLIQRAPDGTLYSAELTQELSDLVTRENLTVETVFAMHSAPVPWKTLLTALEVSKAPKSRQ